MKYLLLFLFLGIPLWPTHSDSPSKAKEITFEQLKKQYFNDHSHALVVLNFWSTWCTPCVKELPNFEKVNQEFKDKNVKIVLVSLDLPKEIDTKLNPFISKHNIKTEVLLLNAPRDNIWIPQVDKNWSGAIPATLIINPKKGTRHFYDHPFTYSELEKTIKQNLAK